MPTVGQLISKARRAAANGYFRQSVAALVVKLAGAGFSFLFGIAVARLYGAAGSGVLGVATTTAVVAANLAIFGLDYLLLRNLAGDIKVGALAEGRGMLRTVGLLVTGLSLAVTLFLAVAGAPLLKTIISDPRAEVGVALAALAVVPLALTRTFSSALRGTGSIIRAQILDGPLAMAASLVMLALLWLGPGPGEAARAFIIYALGAALTAAGAMLLVWRRVRGWPPPAVVPAGPLLVAGFPLAIIVLTGFAADWIILLIVGAHASASEIGQFRVTQQIAMILALIVVSFDSVAGPRVAAAWRVGQIGEIWRNWRQASLIMTALCAPVVLVCLVFPRELLGLFGPEFPPAAPALRILAVGQLVNIVTGPSGSILIMTGQEQMSKRIAIFATVFLAVMGLALVPSLGITGAAIATAAAVVVRKLLGLAATWRALRTVTPPGAGGN